eukprot:6386669-Prorocentrum_lima.AAC.1
MREGRKPARKTSEWTRSFTGGLTAAGESRIRLSRAPATMTSGRIPWWTSQGKHGSFPCAHTFGETGA